MLISTVCTEAAHAAQFASTDVSQATMSPSTGGLVDGSGSSATWMMFLPEPSVEYCTLWLDMICSQVGYGGELDGVAP